jgi:hypothetical protein
MVPPSQISSVLIAFASGNGQCATGCILEASDAPNESAEGAPARLRVVGVRSNKLICRDAVIDRRDWGWSCWSDFVWSIYVPDAYTSAGLLSGSCPNSQPPSYQRQQNGSPSWNSNSVIRPSILRSQTSMVVQYRKNALSSKAELLKRVLGYNKTCLMFPRTRLSLAQPCSSHRS